MTYDDYGNELTAPAEKNAIAEGRLDDILNDPKTTVTERNTGRFGPVTDIVSPNFGGVRVGKGGDFIGVLEQ